jgi:hypothetical protein
LTFFAVIFQQDNSIADWSVFSFCEVVANWALRIQLLKSLQEIVWIWGAYQAFIEPSEGLEPSDG